jgi:hypothetical protein
VGGGKIKSRWLDHEEIESEIRNAVFSTSDLLLQYDGIPLNYKYKTQSITLLSFIIKGRGNVSTRGINII